MLLKILLVDWSIYAAAVKKIIRDITVYAKKFYLLRCYRLYLRNF